MKLPPGLNEHRRAELDGFVRYCAQRIARTTPDCITSWDVRVACPERPHAVVRVTWRGVQLEAVAIAPELAGAIWNAMCRIEQRLCEPPLPLAA